jgi:hypothetical protein
MKLGWAATAVLLLLAAPPAPGQSLGEVAQREKARKERLKKAQPQAPPARVYTDEDLKKAGEGRPAGGSDQAISYVGVAREGRADDERGEGARETPEQRREQRIQEARERVALAEANVKALDEEASRILWAKIQSTDSNEIMQLEEERLRTVTQLETARGELAEARRALKAAEEGSLPPG